jgi:hypothetical protein
VDQGVDLEGSPDLLAFDIEDGRSDVLAADDAGQAFATETVRFPNGGLFPKFRVVIALHGAATFGWEGSTAAVDRGGEVFLGNLSVTSTVNSHILQSVTFRDVASALADFSGFRIEYRDTQGALRSANAQRVDDRVAFSSLQADLPLDVTATLRVYGTADPHAAASRALALRFAPETGLGLVSKISVAVGEQPSIENGGVTITVNTASAVTIR